MTNQRFDGILGFVGEYRQNTQRHLETSTVVHM